MAGPVFVKGSLDGAYPEMVGVVHVRDESSIIERLLQMFPPTFTVLVVDR